MRLSIRLSIHNKSCDDGVSLLPFLERLNQSGFPIPNRLAKIGMHGWPSYSIRSFVDKKVIRLFRPNTTTQRTAHATIDNGSETQLNVFWFSERGGLSRITLNNAALFLQAHQFKPFFRALIQCLNYWDVGACDVIAPTLYSQYFSRDELRSKWLLSWLQYYSKDALEPIGGFAAFESNPYVQTERIHDGLLVQVGDDPSIFDTPEGEQLLINAINALPLIQP